MVDEWILIERNRKTARNETFIKDIFVQVKHRLMDLSTFTRFEVIKE